MRDEESNALAIAIPLGRARTRSSRTPETLKRAEVMLRGAESVRRVREKKNKEIKVECARVCCGALVGPAQNSQLEARRAINVAAAQLELSLHD